jgi:superfamily II helicase
VRRTIQEEERASRINGLAGTLHEVKASAQVVKLGEKHAGERYLAQSNYKTVLDAEKLKYADYM